MKSRISDSRFWSPLWSIYAQSPSIALCRVPELEFASQIDLEGKRILDHCCGDGIFASLAWPDRVLTAGCDLNERSIDQASDKNLYKQLNVCDVSQRLPYEDHSFDIVFNNSALEHVANLDATLMEIARVLTPAGFLVFNVLNHRYFEWWPLNAQFKEEYKDWQPFYHDLSLAEWQVKLDMMGLKIVSVEGYFNRKSSSELALLDCEFSGYYMASRRSRLVDWYIRLPKIMKQYWRWRLSSLSWKTEPDEGAGYFIKAVRDDG